MAVPRLHIARSYAAGVRAKQKDRPLEAMPYDASSTDLTERLRVRAWIRGWRLGR